MAVICVPPALTEEAAVVPLNFATGDAPKLEPLIVTLVPTAPELGVKPLIVGPVPPEAIVYATERSSMARPWLDPVAGRGCFHRSIT
ncbi:MAG: hypothetical protein EBT07_10755 [Actinobacteria bacterium]|nr:hypothetical protein [Actinomycetota bacterium]